MVIEAGAVKPNHMGTQPVIDEELDRSTRGLITNQLEGLPGQTIWAPLVKCYGQQVEPSIWARNDSAQDGTAGCLTVTLGHDRLACAVEDEVYVLRPPPGAVSQGARIVDMD